MARWNVGMVGWRRLHCPERLFSDLYFEPWFYFAGPSHDGSSLWTFMPDGTLEEWDPSDLSSLSMLSVTMDDGGPSGGTLTLAIGPGYVYYFDSSGGDYLLKRASLSTGSATTLVNLGVSPPGSITYCHVDGRLYVVDGNSDLVRYDADGSNATTLATNVFTGVVWTTSYVWTLRTTELVRIRISDGDETTFTTTPGGFYGNSLQSTGTILGEYAAGIDPPAFPDFDNWFFQYNEDAVESIINERVIIEMVEEDPPHGNFIPSTFDEGGCPHFVFSGRVPGGGAFLSSPYSGKQVASGASWFVSDFGGYGALWRFA